MNIFLQLKINKHTINDYYVEIKKKINIKKHRCWLNTADYTENNCVVYVFCVKDSRGVDKRRLGAK